MLLPRVIPCLLLKGTGLVKTVNFADHKYVGDPMNAVRIFNEKEVDELLVLDIVASLEKRSPQFKLIEEIVNEAFMPIAYGGGIGDVESALRLVALGVEKVVVNSGGFRRPELIRDLAQHLGSQSVVVSMDIRRGRFGGYEVYTLGGGKSTGIKPVDHARKMEALGAGEILLNAIDRDGTMSGFDLGLIRQVSEAVSVPVIACGGAGSLEDLKKAITEGKASASAAGSLFVFHGKHRAVLISYPELPVLKKLFEG